MLLIRREEGESEGQGGEKGGKEGRGCVGRMKSHKFCLIFVCFFYFICSISQRFHAF